MKVINTALQKIAKFHKLNLIRNHPMDIVFKPNNYDLVIQETNSWVTAFAKEYLSETEAAAKEQFKCRDKEAVYTVCSKKHFAQMMGLAESLWIQHPDLKLYVCLSDNHDTDTQKWVQNHPRAEVILGKDLSIPHFESIAFKYNIIEYTTALKPYTASYLFKQHPNLERLLYLDTDILIFHSLDLIFNKLHNHDLLLNFHYSEPYPDEYNLQDSNLLYAGTYNSGCYGLKRSEQSTRFLNWWEKKLYNDCRIAPNESIFIDQKWLVFAPLLVKNIYHLYDHGYNVAYWNVHEQHVTYQGNNWNNFKVKDNHPLYFFHYSGFQYQTPHFISRYLKQPKLTPEELEALVKLGYFYAVMLKIHDNTLYQNKANVYDFFDNGTPIPPLIRRLYQNKLLQEKFPEPFKTQEEHSFFNWLLSPAQPNSQINNLLIVLYQSNNTWKKLFSKPFEQEFKFLEFVKSAQHQLQLPDLFLQSTGLQIKQ